MVLLVNNLLKASKSFGLRLQEYSIFLKYNSKNNLNKFVSSGNKYRIRFQSNFKAAVLKETNKSFVFEDVQPKRLGKNQVRIATHTCALNASDLLMCQGVSRIQPKLPFVPGYEVAGEVLELNIVPQPAKKKDKKNKKDKAKKCDKDDDDDDDDDDDEIIPLAVGDRVIGLSRENLGGFSEQCVVDYKDVWRLPASLDFVTAVGLVDTYSLALLGLFRRANIQNCDHVLVTAGAGGLGTAAVDIAANVYKSKVIAVCNSEGCAEQLRSRGAWSAITYTDKQLINSVKDITEKRGVDIVFETIGGGVFESAIRSVAPEGKVIIGGFASQQIPDIPMSELLTLPSFSLIGVSLRNYRETNFKVYRQIVDDVLQLSQQGMVTPLVSKTFKLDKVNDALQHIKETEEIGKIVLLIEK